MSEFPPWAFVMLAALCLGTLGYHMRPTGHKNAPRNFIIGLLVLLAVIAFFIGVGEGELER